MRIRLLPLFLLVTACFCWKLTCAQETALPEQAPVYTDTLDDPSNFSTLGNINIGQYLGWVNDDSANTCGGYYLAQPMLYSGPTIPDKTPIEKVPVQITAESGQFYFKGKSTLSGNVLVMQPDRQILADNAYVYRAPNGDLKDINMLGNVHLQEPGKLLIADVATVPIKDEAISHFSLYDVIYRVTLKRLQIEPLENVLTTSKDKPATKETGLVAWGYAKQVEQTAADQLDLRHASYSTCPPDDKTCAWHLTANDLHLDKTEGRGTAYGSTLWLRHLPVMYLPYFSFPLDDRRKSGLLYPSFTNSSNSGYSFVIPYYANLAPNYDLTLYPNFYEERGTYLNSDFRYLTRGSVGSVDVGVLPDDRKFQQFQKDALTEYTPGDQLTTLEENSDTRTNFHWLDNTQLTSNWTGHVDYNYVSDDYFLEDIAQSNMKQSDDQLLQQGNVNYYGEYWTFQGLLKNYQTLHPINQDQIYNQYARLPELDFNTDIPDQIPGVDYGLSSQFDYFYIAQDPDVTTIPTTGYRVNMRPGINLPNNKPYGYLTPGLQVDSTSYQLSHPSEGDPADPTRVLPLFDIDSGLYFDKDTPIWGKSYLQTLEPRLYYLYVPYENQNNLPDFDSTLYTLTYDQLFQNNRFSSVDRVGDANQISYGATTRFIDQTSGTEKMNFSMGEILYFQDRQVSLCDTETCNRQDTEEFSPIVAQTNYFLSQHWSFSGDTAYDSEQQDFQNASATIHYKQDERRVVNLGYSFVGEGELYTDQYDGDTNLANLSQIHASYAWPLVAQWNTLGSVDWDTSYTNGVSFMFGAEYSACCWGVSFMVNQELSGVNNGQNQYDRVYYVQFVLKGLGEVNSRDSSSLVAQNIENYQNNFVEAF
ncbi:MAG: LPS assembly protein LptD [Pseudomonadota bacterium]